MGKGARIEILISDNINPEDFKNGVSVGAGIPKSCLNVKDKVMTFRGNFMKAKMGRLQFLMIEKDQNGASSIPFTIGYSHTNWIKVNGSIVWKRK